MASKQARVIVQPHYDSAVEASKPVVTKAMEISEPHRKKTGEVLAVYRGKFDESVGAPAGKVKKQDKTNVKKTRLASLLKGRAARLLAVPPTSRLITAFVSWNE